MSFRSSLFRPWAVVPAALLVALSIAAAPARAADPIDAAQKAAIEKIVRDYIIAHPEIIEEAMAAQEQRKTAAAAAAQKEIITEKNGVLFQSARHVVLGNPKGDVTVVEFFDYNCTYCKRSVGDMLTILQEDKNVRFVLKEFPVLGQGSVEAAQVSVAVNRIAPAKYIEFHKTLIGGKGEANRQRAMEAAAAVGIDIRKLEAELAHPEIAATIDETYSLANGLGLTGTPTYVLANGVTPGAVGLERLKAKIADARNCKESC
jgi:protein-disulfide isomerase